MTQIAIKELTRRYGETVAVNRLNLDIASGEMVALLGPSGCGKTTTLRMITGLLLPTSGDILFDGKSMLPVPTEKRGAVMVFQKHLLFPTMSVAQNVGFGLRMQGVKKSEIDARVREMMRLVKLTGFETRRAHELSGGQQQRIALARALIVQPKLLLLDEPLANLDANLRLEMRELIRSIQRDLGITTILVTHDQEEAVMLADRVALMFEGKLQQYDVPQAFYERPASLSVAAFFRNENVLTGNKQGDLIESDFGTFAIDPSHSNVCPNGAVMLTVRPEEIRLASGTSATQNTAESIITSAVYMGTYTQVQFSLGDFRWTAHLPADCPLRIGERAKFYLPPRRIWCWQSQ